MCSYIMRDSIVGRVTIDPRYYKLFVILGPSTLIYPLLVRLEMRGLNDQLVPGNAPRTFLDLLEATDFRVFKIRGTSPAKDISFLARDAMRLTVPEISAHLRQFVVNFMSDELLRSELSQDIYPNEALLHVLLRFDECVMKKHGDQPYDVGTLIGIVASEPTIEHVFPQSPTFAVSNYGFTSDDDYRRWNNRLGNLILLEKAINSRCQEKNVEEKVSHPDMYNRSAFPSTKEFRAICLTAGGTFTADECARRTSDIVDFCTLQWPLWS